MRPNYTKNGTIGLNSAIEDSGRFWVYLGFLTMLVWYDKCGSSLMIMNS